MFVLFRALPSGQLAGDLVFVKVCKVVCYYGTLQENHVLFERQLFEHQLFDTPQVENFHIWSASSPIDLLHRVY